MRVSEWAGPAPAARRLSLLTDYSVLSTDGVKAPHRGLFIRISQGVRTSSCRAAAQTSGVYRNESANTAQLETA